MNPTGVGGFQPGKSGNPSGRPKSEGLAGYIHAKTKGGKTLADFWLGVIESTDRKVTMDHKLKAASELADRGFGKALQQADITTNGKELRLFIGGDGNLPDGI